MDRKRIPDFTPGMRAFSTGHLNQLVASANRPLVGVSPISVDRVGDADYVSLQGQVVPWLGRVDASGQPSDWSDFRYFVMPERITLDDGDDSSPWGVNSDSNGPFLDSDEFPYNEPVTVTNLPELQMVQASNGAGYCSHSLEPKRRVLVWSFEDGSSPPAWRHVMHESPQEIQYASSTVTGLTSDVEGFGNRLWSFAATRCDNTGGVYPNHYSDHARGVQTGEALLVRHYQTAGQCAPYVDVGDVVAFSMDYLGRPIAVAGVRTLGLSPGSPGQHLVWDVTTGPSWSDHT